MRIASRARCLLVLFCLTLQAQVIEFESNGLHYKTLTRNGLTIMFASLGMHIRGYTVIQVAISNGSPIAWTIRPQDFTFHHEDGQIATAVPALDVVNSLIQKASRHDVIKLVATYEAGVYGNSRLQSTNGYEARRQSALAEVSSARLKAAAAASAIALVTTRLPSGQSTDGAVFFQTNGKPLGPGKLVIHAGGEDFEFPNEESGAR